ncbi:hypothetical protein QL285_074607 [Trifolium repens]|nr:hypothetical protein QL285_074607 [Trifolium repens]
MTEKLLKANREAKMDHLLKQKKRLEDEFVKLKQELAEKLKEKRGLEDESVKLKQELAEKDETYSMHQIRDDGKSLSISQFAELEFLFCY